ncbi:patatin-like phospholipase family protein [Pseudenhygromyxa sp. WMMC2535]|uniref:patatin-like phospholipase family protein n=1 Tax=Pseudenhygromyxa sp. WMMC2535 TaxID=2712867 RepID=UPI0015956D65|nr:patatin-like phospholipase family protein [Pseudenhygromyxa sp. WMMC2535]NVB37623.1 patatin-like phospholipase family protein [Pseudenhygromyxa sp. WMMC2535]
MSLIRKSKNKRLDRPARIALVLAGGAITGGAFKMGGLKALNDFLVGRDIANFDIYVGLSAGAMLSVPLAAGVSPDELMRVIDGTSTRFAPLEPRHLYTPNVGELAGRPAALARDFATWYPSVALDFLRGLPALPGTFHDALGELLRSPDYAHLERMAMRMRDEVSPRRGFPAVSDAVPTGFFTNAPLERWLRQNLERIGVSNDFATFAAERGRQLYVAACTLDTAERRIFGPDEDHAITISEAVQASTALPIVYKPARINGVDYVDGAVRNTANIDVAIDKGADLVICYNPFRPIWNEDRRPDPNEPESMVRANKLPATLGERRITDQGLKGVLNQVFRTLLQSRLVLGLERYRHHASFEGDIVVLEPKEHDLDFFAMNPMAFWKRDAAMRHGFESVRNTIQQNFDVLEDVLGRYGLRMSQAVASRRAAELERERGWGEAERPRSTGGRLPWRRGKQAIGQ